MATFSKTDKALLARGIDEAQIEYFRQRNLSLSELRILSDEELQKHGLRDEQIKTLRPNSRKKIPAQTLLRLLYESKRICCICRNPDRPIVIHHIDEWNNSHDNSYDNLVVLCIEHHEEAHTTRRMARSLFPAEVRDAKKKWIEEVKRQDAKIVSEKFSTNSSSRWDYVNLHRFYELLLESRIRELNEGGVTIELQPELIAHNIIDRKGYINDANEWEAMKPGSSHLYDFSRGFLLVHYIKKQLDHALSKIPLIDITDKFKRNLFESTLKPGDYFFLQRAFYFKAQNNHTQWKGQLRKAYTQSKKEKLKLEFVFDAYETTSCSAKNLILTGHTNISIVAKIVSITEQPMGYITACCSCIAIGCCRINPFEELLKSDPPKLPRSIEIL